MNLPKLILATIISLSLFFGGILIFLGQVRFWSAFFGIASIQIGIVFLIFTYEQMSKNSTIEDFKNYAVSISQNTSAKKKLHVDKKSDMLKSNTKNQS